MFRSCQIIIRGALSLAKGMLQYSQFNSYLQTRCCGSMSCFKNIFKHSDMFRSCQIIIMEFCSLLKLCYTIHNSIRICNRGVVAACHVLKTLSNTPTCFDLVRSLSWSFVPC